MGAGEAAQPSDPATTLVAVIQGAQPAATTGPNWYRIGPVLVLAIVVGVIVWLIVKGGDDNKDTSASPPASAATVGTLRTLRGQLGHDVYWAGKRPRFTFELTQLNGNTFIRYLPSGIAVGDPRPNYLTIGTYPKAHSSALLERQARRRGNQSRPVAGGGLAVWRDARPQSVYVAYPGSDVWIEVYDPSAARARRLATSGAVTPIR
jgi:hypothetical protein